jgi:hypothetical protein
MKHFSSLQFQNLNVAPQRSLCTSLKVFCLIIRYLSEASNTNYTLPMEITYTQSTKEVP